MPGQRAAADPEIQYLAYLHNAEDQLRGEAATLSFFSAGALRNPLVVRVAGLAYQEAFGGHFHNDNAVAVLRDVPGLVLAVPGRPADAAPMLRSCIAAAAIDGTVCVFLEPIALYHVRDLFQPGDNEWLAPYAAPGDWPGAHVPIGRARTYPVGSAEDLTIVTFGNGVRMSLRVAARLAKEGSAPGSSTCAGSPVAGGRPGPGGHGDRPRPGRGRDAPLRRRRRRHPRRAGGRRFRRAPRGGSHRPTRSIPLGPAAEHVLVGEDAVTQGAHALLAR